MCSKGNVLWWRFTAISFLLVLNGCATGAAQKNEEFSVLIEKASSQYEAGLLTEAEASYRKVTDLRPDYYEPWLKLGNIFVRTGQLEAAVRMYRKCTELRPDDVRGWSNLSLTRLKQSLAVLDDAQEYFPSDSTGASVLREFPGVFDKALGTIDMDVYQMIRHGCAHKQRGSFIVESVWLWPVLVMMTLGVIQMGFLYNAKATMNNATFQAAREGSIKHADKGAMEKRLAFAMAPLYIKKSKDVVELASKRVYLQALMSVPLASIGKVEIISPEKEVYRKFEKTQYYLDNKGREKRIKQMPNDNLNARSVSNNFIKTASGNIKINLQDANLLKIRGHWCYEMIVPFVNYVIYQTYSALPGGKNPHWRACRTLSIANDSYYLPVSSTSVVRMQTPIRW